MKTYKNLYRKFCSLENIEQAFKKARKRKTARPAVIYFERDLTTNLMSLYEDLKRMTYTPLPLKRFIVCDPKSRTIHASSFRDRIVHHAVINILEPIFEKRFIADSYASRKNKGTLSAILRVDFFKMKVSQNGKLVGRSGKKQKSS